MDEPFHPSTLSEILDRTAQLYRAHFLVFLGIAAIPTAALVAPLGSIILLIRWMGVRGDSPTTGIVAGLGIGVASLVAVPLYIGVTSLATAATNHAASRAIFAQPINVRHAYKAVWARGWRYVGLYLVELGAVWVLPLGAWTAVLTISAMLATLLGSAGSTLLALLAILIISALFVYALWMSIRLSLAYPAIIVEQSGAWTAMRRSWLLTSGTRGRIFLLYLLGSALSSILSLAIMVPALFVLSLFPGAATPQNTQTTGMVAMLIIYGSNFVIQAFVRPVYGIGCMLFYYDQRIRHEGFDIEWMMLQAGMVVPPAATPPAAIPAAMPADPIASDLAATPRPDANGTHNPATMPITQAATAPVAPVELQPTVPAPVPPAIEPHLQSKNQNSGEAP
jgi:hypothetical protein